VPLLTLVLIAGANLLVLKSHYGQFANDYNDEIRHISLAIPAHVLLFCYFPVVALAMISIFKEADNRWRLRIDYVIVPKRIEGAVPSKIVAFGPDYFRFYQVSN